MTERALVLSDAHLSSVQGQGTARALARLLADHPGVEMIWNGDIFDLSFYPHERPLAHWLHEIFAAQPELTRALRDHFHRGGRLRVVPGNHDAWLTEPGADEELRRLLGVPAADRLTLHPWFLRRGDVHLEHGHLYDPDNTFTHPLAPFDPRTEPLGTALMRRFVFPNDAYFFAHAHRTTPLGGFLLTLRKWRFRSPLVIASYFYEATKLVFEAAGNEARVREEKREGERRLAERARETGLDPELLRRVIDELAAIRTNESAKRTFFRLYFDRVLTALGSVGGATGLLSLGLRGAVSGEWPSLAVGGSVALATSGAALYLTHDVRTSRNRYGGNIVEALTETAHRLRHAVSARTVLFGHTHVPLEEPGYVNLGSFGYGHPERSFAWLTDEGHVELARAPR